MRIEKNHPPSLYASHVAYIQGCMSLPLDGSVQGYLSGQRFHPVGQT